MQITDYLKKYAGVSFDQSPVNEVDLAILTEISYVTLDAFVPRELSSKASQPLTTIYRAFQSGQSQTSSLLQEARRKLLAAVVQSERFKDVRLYAFSGETDQASGIQFAALAFDLGKATHVLVMRGTDGSFVGWQEDFNLAADQPMPSQQAALNYLERVLKANPHPYFLLGHSKGGHLVTEAAIKLRPDWQERIQAIYSFDGPGVLSSSYQTSGYRAIQDKLLTYLPQDARVGILLESDGEAEVIKSAGISYLQHMMLLWQVEDCHFVRVKDVSLASQASALTITIFQAWQSNDSIQQFFDLVFALMYQTGFRRWETVSTDLSEFLTDLFDAVKDLDQKDRRFIFSMVYDLRLISQQVKLGLFQRQRDQVSQGPSWFSYRLIVQNVSQAKSPWSLALAFLLMALGLVLPFQSLAVNYHFLAGLMFFHLLFSLGDGLVYFRSRQKEQPSKARLVNCLLAFTFLLLFLCYFNRSSLVTQLHFFFTYLLLFAANRVFRLYRFYQEQACLSGTGIGLLVLECSLACLFLLHPSLTRVLPYLLAAFFILEGVLILYSRYTYRQKKKLYDFIAHYLAKEDL